MSRPCVSRRGRRGKFPTFPEPCAIVAASRMYSAMREPISVSTGRYCPPRDMEDPTMGADKTNQENSSKPEQAQQNESAPGKLGDEPQQAEPGKDAAASEEQRKSRLPG